MSPSLRTFRTRIQTTALLLGLSLAAACGDSPTESSNGGGAPAPVPTDPAAVASVRVSPDTATLLSMGGHRMVQATALGTGGEVLQGRPVSWTSSDATVATVDASGNVTAHQPGRAFITATVDGKTAQARVDVVPVSVDSIALSAPWITVEWGTQRPLGATLYAADDRLLHDRTVTWTTSDSSVAVVDALGRVTATGGGRAWITATSEGRSARAEVIVPLIKVMTLGSVNGREVEALVSDSIHQEADGSLRRVRIVAAEGTLSLHSREGTYQQRVVLRFYERRGSCTEWGSCIWEVEERLVEQRLVFDRGEILYNVFTGEPIFESSVVEGWTYYAQNAANDAFTVWQGLPGTGVVLPWVYEL
jgi:Bacterial Ig-like domain (group 2)